MRHSTLALALALTLHLPACGGDDELDRDVVTSIPPGNAAGSAASGTYSLQIRTVSCTGACPTYKVLGFTVSLCSVGDSDSETVKVTQTDGVLDVSEIGSSLYVEQLRGGINQDGTFDVGGYQIQSGTSVAVTARAQGTINPGGTLVGSARAKGTGSYDGQNIACTGSFEISGQRH